MSTVLGAEPDDLTVHLTDGADFSATLILRTEAGGRQDWPAGAALDLYFPGGPYTWSAALSGAEATFNETSVTVGNITDGDAVQLRYTEGTLNQTWAIGTVSKHA